jgi:hypothetical protein
MGLGFGARIRMWFLPLAAALMAMAWGCCAAAAAPRRRRNRASSADTANRPAAQTLAPPPAEVRQMLQLMENPQVKQWMTTQMQAAPSAAGDMSADQMSVLSSLLAHARAHFNLVSDAAMTLPTEVESASEIVERDVSPKGWAFVTLELLVLFLAGPVAKCCSG